MKLGRWSRRFCRQRAQVAARERPTRELSSLPFSIYCAPAVSGGCCRMSSRRGVPSTTIISGVGKLQGWVQLHRTIYEQVRVAAGREACPSVVIMDGQSVKTTERGGTRGFAGHKRVNGRKRHILVDTLGFPIASRVERADTSDRCACSRLLAGLAPLFPRIHTVMADAGHESRNLAGELLRNEEWKLLIVKRANQSRWNVSSAVRPTNQMLSKPKL
jgi:DDE family transposase